MPLHDEAERSGPLNAIVSQSITLQEYRHILERLYGFVLPAEHVIEPLIVRYLSSLDYEKLKRCPHLENDLTFLGLSVDELETLPQCDALTSLDTLPQALGVLYLFEGSRLGGKVLAKSLVEGLGLSELRGCAYFASNGANVGILWPSFKDVVNRYVAAQGHDQEIIESAQKGFAALNSWLLEK